MKYLISIFLVLQIAICGFSQTDTLTSSDFTARWITPDSRAVLYTVIDTVTADDTLFVNVDTTEFETDTILEVFDTVTVDLLGVLGASMSGMLTFQSDTIATQVALTDGDVGFSLYQSACEDCPYYAITSTDGTHSTPPDDSNKFFQLRGLKLRLVYWAISGASWVRADIVLKPSSLSNNASN